MPDLIENLGFADGISGNSIKMFLDGVPVLALQNFNWKIKKGKKPLFGAGFKTAHGVTRSAHNIYEIDFEIKEILSNSAINVAQTAKNLIFLSTFEDFTDQEVGKLESGQVVKLITSNFELFNFQTFKLVLFAAPTGTNLPVSGMSNRVRKIVFL